MVISMKLIWVMKNDIQPEYTLHKIIISLHIKLEITLSSKSILSVLL